jgi:hypothetical protein
LLGKRKNKNMKQTNKGKTSGEKKGGSGAAFGVGVLAALAGAYFLYGSKDAAKNRKKIKGWTLKAKGEVLEKLEKVQDTTETEYGAIVDAVMRKYAAMKSVDTSEVDSLGKDLKRHWKNFKKEVTKVKKA